MEKNKQKSERSVRISESSRDNQPNSSSIRSELDEVKQILRSMNERYRDHNPSGGYPRNFRQSGSNRNDFDGQIDIHAMILEIVRPDHWTQITIATNLIKLLREKLVGWKITPALMQIEQKMNTEEIFQVKHLLINERLWMISLPCLCRRITSLTTPMVNMQTKTSGWNRRRRNPLELKSSLI